MSSQGRASSAAPRAGSSLGTTIPSWDPVSSSDRDAPGQDAAGTSYTGWVYEGQAGSCPPPPSSSSAVGPRPCRGAGNAPAAGWGLACAGTASLTRLVPAPSPVTPLSRNRGRTHVVALAPHSAPRSGVSPASPRPGELLPPARRCRCICVATSRHMPCARRFRQPVPGLFAPRRREPARRLCPAGQAGAVWQRRALPSRARAGKALGRPNKICEGAQGMPPTLTRPRVFPHPEQRRRAALRASGHGPLVASAQHNGGPSPGTPSCPKRRPQAAAAPRCRAGGSHIYPAWLGSTHGCPR